jgi:hypothetical protein
MSWLLGYDERLSWGPIYHFEHCYNYHHLAYQTYIIPARQIAGIGGGTFIDSRYHITQFFSFYYVRLSLVAVFVTCRSSLSLSPRTCYSVQSNVLYIPIRVFVMRKARV